MKIWKKALSAGLSLALCAGMVLPSFAASFADLQNAIDGTSDTSETQFNLSERKIKSQREPRANAEKTPPDGRRF